MELLLGVVCLAPIVPAMAIALGVMMGLAGGRAHRREHARALEVLARVGLERARPRQGETWWVGEVEGRAVAVTAHRTGSYRGRHMRLVVRAIALFPLRHAPAPDRAARAARWAERRPDQSVEWGAGPAVHPAHDLFPGAITLARVDIPAFGDADAARAWLIDSAREVAELDPG
jgi:hypothetical protein